MGCLFCYRLQTAEDKDTRLQQLSNNLLQQSNNLLQLNADSLQQLNNNSLQLHADLLQHQHAENSSENGTENFINYSSDKSTEIYSESITNKSAENYSENSTNNCAEIYSENSTNNCTEIYSENSTNNCAEKISLQQFSENEAVVAVWKVTETLEEIEARLQNRRLVEEAEARFKAPHRKLEWLAVRLLLQEVFSEPLEIGYEPSGRPILNQGKGYISISHTKGYVAVIVGKQEVGIDIEQYGPRVHRVKEKFMRTDEVAQPYEGDDTWSLLLHWSAKETLFKVLHTTEVDFREHLHIFPFVPQQTGVFEAQELKSPQQTSYRIGYCIQPDFVLTFVY